jgi:hypothetical protein
VNTAARKRVAFETEEGATRAGKTGFDDSVDVTDAVPAEANLD